MNPLMFWRNKKTIAKEASLVLLSVTQGNFPELSSVAPPERLLELVNANLVSAEDTILRQGGRIVHMIGDCVIAVWFEEEKFLQRRVCAEVSESMLRSFRGNAVRLMGEFSVQPRYVLSWAGGLCIIKESCGRIHDAMGYPMYRIRAISASHPSASTDMILVDNTVKRAWEEGTLEPIDDRMFKVRRPN